MKVPYGYTKDNLGDISINEEKADVVRLIFQSYQAGLSFGKISDLLKENQIPSPTGNTNWTRAAINKLLSNPKYILIVGTETYFNVQFEMHNRSNINEDIGNRKAARYCSPSISSGFELSFS